MVGKIIHMLLNYEKVKLYIRRSPKKCICTKDQNYLTPTGYVSVVAATKRQTTQPTPPPQAAGAGFATVSESMDIFPIKHNPCAKSIL
jgi:hypothetical protein